MQAIKYRSQLVLDLVDQRIQLRQNPGDLRLDRRLDRHDELLLDLAHAGVDRRRHGTRDPINCTCKRFLERILEGGADLSFDRAEQFGNQALQGFGEIAGDEIHHLIDQWIKHLIGQTRGHCVELTFHETSHRLLGFR